MSPKFDNLYKSVMGEKTKKSDKTSDIEPKQTVITEKVESIKRQKITLVSAYDPLKDETPLVLESINELGFKSAPSEEFIGAKDKTYFIDIDNPNGRTTVIYDFQPTGNQGKPAIHLYYSANDCQISESLVCFNAPITLGQIRQILEVAKSIHPNQALSKHDIKSPSEFIEYITLDTK